MLNIFKYLYADTAEPWQLSFQDAATPVAEGIAQLHDNVMFYLVLTVIGVFMDDYRNII